MFDEQGRQAVPRRARQGTPEALADAAAQWLRHLPQHVRPLKTEARFPHIVNALEARWRTPESCRGYFDQLLLDQRGSRRGFPRSVAAELAALKDYYDSVVHPTQQTVWDVIRCHAAPE